VFGFQPEHSKPEMLLAMATINCFAMANPVPEIEYNLILASDLILLWQPEDLII
jgi:hypothetical protein